MRRRIISCLSVALFFGLIWSRFAAAGTRLSLGVVPGYHNVTVSVPISLVGETNAVALQFDLVFDPAVVSSAPSLAGPVLGNRVLSSSQVASGIRRVLIYSLNNVPLNNGVIANLPFTVAPNTFANVARLSLTNVIVATASAQSLVTTNLAGAVAINPVFLRPDGDVDFLLTATGGQNYRIQASTTLTNWSDLSTISAIGNFIEFTDTQAHNFPYRFYRAIPGP